MITTLFLSFLLSFSSIIVSENLTQRFDVPENAERVSLDKHSFGAYLRHLSLKPRGTKVHLYNGQEKNYQGGVAAVVDLDVGQKDLQQCADAVMRLRAEYLFQEQRFEDIQFHLTNDFLVTFDKWSQGYRVKVKGNQTWWEKLAAPSNSYETLRGYLEFVFIYAGTLSLAKELSLQTINNIMPGDVFIQGGSPGHAVIVMDVAVNNATGERYFMLAQSYMPAQEIHIIKNLNDQKLSPWYSSRNLDKLYTPEWTFSKEDLRRF